VEDGIASGECFPKRIRIEEIAETEFGIAPVQKLMAGGKAEKCPDVESEFA
jgi:hypothetical protein